MVLTQDEAVLVARLAVGAADAVHAAVQVAQSCNQCREKAIKDLKQLTSLMKRLQYDLIENRSKSHFFPTSTRLNRSSMRLQIQIRLLYVRSANYGQKIVGIIDSNSAFVSRQDELDDACKKDTKMASQDYEEDDEEEKQRQ